MKHVLPLMLLLASCSYNRGLGELDEKYSSISVPFVCGDDKGDLTKELIRELSRSSCLTYENEGADLILSVKIVTIDEINVGFRYDRNKKGKLTDEIIPSETRLRALADVSLIDASNGCPIFDSVLIEAFYVFDHDYYSSRNAVNIFSLGQLSDYDEGYDAALRPLYLELAKKIITFINNAG